MNLLLRKRRGVGQISNCFLRFGRRSLRPP
jgi:hypothetical protein